FIGFYIIHIIGYSMQTASTKGGGTIITSDPKQRPVLAFYYGAVGMVALLAFMSYIPVAAGQFELNMLDPLFWRHIAVVSISLSFITMVLAVIGIWKKDVKENYQGFTSEKVKVRDFIGISRSNRAISMLCIAAATDKLAFSLTGAVEIYMYSNILLNQNLAGVVGMLSLPMIVLFTIFGTRIG
ncbi:MAG: MFS transporter, partial [Erysipelotrichaceae bacterium]